MRGRDHGPKVGDTAPDFTLPAAMDGQEYRLRQWAGQDVLLVFFRGTWCPFCREQMQILRERHDTLAAAGVQVVGVVCQNRASVRRFLEAAPLPFPLLVDARRDVAHAYGVHYWLSLEGFHLAKPALFILDGAGRITFRYVGANMGDLPLTSVLERFIGFLDKESPRPAKG